MSKIYFISDIHLGGESKDTEARKTECLLSFLNAIQESAEILYIVGDLYNFWFEYRNAVPRLNLRVLTKLCEFIAQDIDVRYFTGNHDLWHETYIEEQLGLKLYREPFSVVHHNRKFFIAHGDGLIDRDRRIRRLRKIFTNPVNIFLYKLIHPDLGIPFANYVARKSAERGDNPYDQEYRDFALAKLHEGFDAVILGHTHKPLFERLGNGLYINLGDWINSFTYLVLDEGDVELKKWFVEQSET
jgi:UDP-2,3-diacylglucosamine hydrolase